MGNTLKWEDRYNCHSTQIGGVITIGVSWHYENSKTVGGYEIKVNGKLLHKNNVPVRYTDLDTAKKVAVGYAVQKLKKALTEAEAVFASM